MKVTEAAFVKGFVRMANDGWEQGHGTGDHGGQDAFHWSHPLQPVHRLLTGRTSTCTQPAARPAFAG